MKSKYKGVTYISRPTSSRNFHDRWKAQITVGGKTRYLGSFEDEERAARMVDNARICLQEFFPTPFHVDMLNRPIREQEGITRRVEELLALLEQERAERFPRDFSATSPAAELNRSLSTLRSNLVSITRYVDHLIGTAEQLTTQLHTLEKTASQPQTATENPRRD